MDKLLNCPFCGGEAQVRYYADDCCHWAYTVYCKDWKCSSSGTPSETEEQAIAAWDRRYEAPPKPLTLDELKKMDGEPVYIVENPDWGHWELSADAEDYFEDRDEDFYGMKHNDPAGRYGLHLLGWLAFDREPGEWK